MTLNKWKYFFISTCCFLGVTKKTYSTENQLTLNGFGSIYAAKSLTNSIYENSLYQNKLDFTSGTLLGVNLRFDLTNEIAAIAQLITSGNEHETSGTSNPTWHPRLDWFYLSYSPNNLSLNFKIGQQLLPLFIVAEYGNVGLTYPWSKPPEEIYGLGNLKSMSGLSATYHLAMGNDASGMLQIFGGQSFTHSLADETYEVSINRIFGGRLKIQGDGWEVQTVGASANIELMHPNGYYGLTQAPSPFVNITPITLNLKANHLLFWSVGGKYDKNNLLAYAEYTQSSTNDGDPSPLPGQSTFLYKSYGYYGTLGYHIGAFLPHYTYAYSMQNVGLLFGHERSYTVGINYQINPTLVLKNEYSWRNDAEGAISLSNVGVAQTLRTGFDFVF